MVPSSSIGVLAPDLHNVMCQAYLNMQSIYTLYVIGKLQTILQGVL